MTTGLEDPAADSATPTGAVVYRIAWRWRIFALVILTPGLVWPVAIALYWHSFPSRGALLGNLIPSIALLDVLASGYWWSVFYPRLAVSKNGVEYRGPGAYMLTSWDNVLGTKSIRSGMREISGLRLVRPRLRRSGLVHLLVKILPWVTPVTTAMRYQRDESIPAPFQGVAAAGASSTASEPEDGTTQGGIVPAGKWESDPSSTGQPNDFIPLDNFDPNWWSGSLGAQIRRYAPQVFMDPASIPHDHEVTDPAKNWRPPEPSRLGILRAGAVCIVVLLVEISAIYALVQTWTG